MNYTVIPKSIMNFQTGNSKPVDVYVWAVIKCCSNHKTNISHVTEEKLSLLTGLDERSIRRSIKRLKDAGYLTVQTSTIKEDTDRGFIKRNSYFIKPANKDYFFLDNSFFKRNYPAKIAGFLLLLKAICLNNTDTVQWNNSQISKAIGLSRNTTTALIKECQQSGLIKRIAKGYELTAGCFINSAVRKADAGIYKEICDFCKKKGAAVLVKGVRNQADYEYEATIADFNGRLGNYGIETVLLASKPELCHISSSAVRDLISFKADVSDYVSEKIIRDIRKKYCEEV